MLSNQQSGFKPSRLALPKEALLTNFWHQTKENSDSNICVFLDIAKGFDTIQHDLVLKVLSQASILGKLLAWFHSYLSNHYQYVPFP